MISVSMQVSQRSLQQMQAGFFYDLAGNEIRHGLSEADHRAQSRMGAFVRRTARRKLSKRGRQKTIAEMSRDELIRYHTQLALHKDRPLDKGTARIMTTAERRKFHIRQKIGKRRGYRHAKPVRPRKAAQRGAPPRFITGLLQKHTHFAFDPSTTSTVVGPADLPSKPDGAPEKLEEGGFTKVTAGPNRGDTVRLSPHPYMEPSLEENLHKFPDLFRDAV
ncbi:MAG: hypothetical protein ACYTGL_14720 [Planctomycetota bacterium]|jgi:hypothetical protein